MARRLAMVVVVSQALALQVSPSVGCRRRQLVWSSQSEEEETPLGWNEDDDAPAVPSGDWRAFRARLIETGLATAKIPEAVEGALVEEGVVTRNGTGQAGRAAARARPKRKTLANASPENLELAKSQSPDLADELTGSWAHPVGAAEVGGLLLRLPLELQLVVARETYWGKRLRQFAASEESRRLMREGTPASTKVFDNGDESETPFHEMLLYRVAGRFIKFELERIARKGKVDDAGRLVIDPRDYIDSWQEVVLVLDHDSRTGSRGVALNRPAATRSNSRLSAALVEALKREETDIPAVDDFHGAFGDRIAAYVGCPASRAPAKAPDGAVLVHGVGDLQGAVELAPGLGIYRGGSKAAVDRIINNQSDQLDFRFFIGTYKWAAGDLDRAIQNGIYRPAACSRALALKQCLNLPTPLWHEVMTMLGGNSEEIARLEYIKQHRGDNATKSN
ncbi:hypothetical protein CTAYLR_006694 [Chrysophaeum taylorii]|uniref:Uncharacterized protein n=1 Tax=Chrysophaeum taylorii TaxID=2483200 RepID=A0AAD7XKN6_9STRA|nr:hypothetical protein CTAYLR_006694 [Chrysophaeum taylorii]